MAQEECPWNFGVRNFSMKKERQLKGVIFCIVHLSSYTAAFEYYAGVIIYGTIIEEFILWVHLHPDDFCQLLALAVEHLCLEPLVHAVPGPFSVRIEIEIPVIDAWNLYGVTVQLDGIGRSAAVRVTILVLENDEEYVR